MAPQVGFYAFIGAGVLVIVVPIITKLGHTVGYLRYILQDYADRRLKLSTEMFQGMRIVKYYAWEKPFLAKIRASRKREVDKIRVLSTTRSFLFFFVYAAPPVTCGTV